MLLLNSTENKKGISYDYLMFKNDTQHSRICAVGKLINCPLGTEAKFITKSRSEELLPIILPFRHEKLRILSWGLLSYVPSPGSTHKILKSRMEGIQSQATTVSCKYPKFFVLFYANIKGQLLSVKTSLFNINNSKIANWIRMFYASIFGHRIWPQNWIS